MPSVLAYHRPQSLDEAQKLASQKNTFIIGGGTLVIPDVLSSPTKEAVIIDLQAVGLTGIFSELSGGQSSVKIGAMTRLSELIGNEKIPMIVHELSSKELPSTLRTQATIGGTIADRNGESILLSGFLALNAEIEINCETWIPLNQFLQSEPLEGIITALRFNIPTAESETSFHSVGRTPMDVPIVSGIGYAQSNGNLQVSLTGVSKIPVLVKSDDDIENLDPESDFRGSSAYRKHLASVIFSRITEEVQK